MQEYIDITETMDQKQGIIFHSKKGRLRTSLIWAAQTLALVRCWNEFFFGTEKSRGGFADNCNCSACKRKATENK